MASDMTGYPSMTGYPRDIGECDELERNIKAAFQGDDYNVQVMWRFKKDIGPAGIHGASFGWKDEKNDQQGGDV